jgi:hypothetical protein
LGRPLNPVGTIAKALVMRGEYTVVAREPPNGVAVGDGSTIHIEAVLTHISDLAAKNPRGERILTMPVKPLVLLNSQVV